MTKTQVALITLLALLLSGCAGTGGAAASQQAAAEAAAREAEFEAQRQREEQLLAQERAREAAARDAAAREDIARRAEEARIAAERLEAESARTAAAVQRQPQAQPDAQRAAARAQEVARQQAQIAELRAKISANNTETANLESANVTLLEAIETAERLAAALAEEQQKYAATDPATGQTVEELSKATLDELSAELERLQAQAAALSRQSP